MQRFPLNMSTRQMQPHGASAVFWASSANSARKAILARMIEGGNLSQYGLHAAIMRTAEDSTDYDRATKVEYLGGKVVELPRTEWARLAEAA